MGASHQTGRTAIIRGIIVDLGVMTAIGIVLALIGPFGSFQDPLAIRLIVWVGFAWLGYLLYAPIDVVAQRLAPILDLPEWALRIAGCAIASVPMSIAVWVLPRLPGELVWPDASRALEHYVLVFFVGGLITLVNSLIHRRPPAGAIEKNSTPIAPSSPAPPIAQPETPFLDRLPSELGTDLLALEMEDHYVRAHTALGNDLVLMRLRDAVAELESVPGMQVHRSWWVARGAVEDVRREGRNVRLVLAGGLEAPVSRANVQPLKDAGWL